MTVKELKQLLSQYPDDMEIVNSRYSDWNIMSEHGWREVEGVHQGEWVMQAHPTMSPENKAKVKKYLTFDGDDYEEVKALLRRRRRQGTNDKYRNDGSRTTAKNAKRLWSDQDKRLLFDTTLSDREIAVKIGRSLRAIIKMRCVCHHMAPEGWVGKGTPAQAIQKGE